MRLDDFDSSINVEDQRGGRLPLGGPGGKLGCGTIVIALIAAVVFGVDPAQMLGTLQRNPHISYGRCPTSARPVTILT